MKSKTEEININEEFEKILPPTLRKSLFDDYEDYNSLREYIIAHPYNFLHKGVLPFSDVELINSVDLRINKFIEWTDKELCSLETIYKNSEGLDKKLIGETVELLLSPILDVLQALQNKGQ